MRTTLLRFVLRVCMLGTLLCLGLRAAPDLKKNYDLPAGDAAQRLRQFAEVSGRETLFAAETVRGVRTTAVKGEFTPEEALGRMLAGTALTVSPDAQTGALAIKRESLPNVQRAAPVAASVRPANDPQAEAGTVRMEQVEVTGSRISTILGEQGVNPVLMFTRDEIERTGVTSLSDLRSLIPQLAVGNTTTFDGNSSGSSPEGRLTFTLRGITGNNTLILVDGRRVPRTGQRVAATENYELTNMPLSAIERVEVLLDGGSAVYGADAIGGVINIITRKNYSGSEIEYAYDNTFDKDAANKRLSLSTSHRLGKFSLRASVSFEHQNALARRDRYWLRSNDRRYLGGTDGRSTVPVGGQVTAVSVAQGGSGTLPGTNGATTLKIPANSNGRNLTIADFVAAGAPTDADRYDGGQVLNALNEFTRSNYSLNTEYALRSWLRLSLAGNFSRNLSYGLSDPVSLSTAFSTNAAVSTVLPATYPGNPFGVPINVSKYLWELGELNRRYQMDTEAFTLGLRGDLPWHWKYDGGISWTKSTPRTLDQVFQITSAALAPAMRSANPPILLNNSLLGPANPAGTFESLFLLGANGDVPQTWTYELKADGPVYAWRAGQISAAVGAEVREEYVQFNREFFAATTEAAQPTGHRTVQAGFAEASVPLVGEGQRVPLVNQLRASLAVRYDRYNEFGHATKPRYGLSYRPAKWLMLRGTYGEAFKIPTLSDLNRPTSSQTQTFAPTGSFVLVDTYRNNEQVLGSVINITGGNPNLQPEESTTRNYGIILESPFALFKGFSLSVDHWDIRMTNRVGSVSYQERLAFRPDLFTRAAPTAAETALGWLGKITAVDNRSINIAQFNTAGHDFSLRYQKRTARWGEFAFRATATKTTRYESITRPGLTPVASQSAVLRPLRGTGSFDWFKWGLGLGATATYQDGFRTSATSATTQTPSTILWNARFSYDFDQGELHAGLGRAARWMRGVRLNLGLLNALNLEPPLTSTGGTTGAVDPRLRRYTITFRKKI